MELLHLEKQYSQADILANQKKFHASTQELKSALVIVIVMRSGRKIRKKEFKKLKAYQRLKLDMEIGDQSGPSGGRSYHQKN